MFCIFALYISLQLRLFRNTPSSVERPRTPDSMGIARSEWMPMFVQWKKDVSSILDKYVLFYFV